MPNPTNRIIQAEFEGYARHVYFGLAPGSDQYEQLLGAFFAGAAIALRHSEDADDMMDMESELEAFPREAPIANRVLGEKAS
jgi:hypothetical protein